ncbi:hypothetical protein P5F75_14870 [Caldifermentibacillus hisashii]|uniref:hypothetical protein n=1 Tax=Caldifermentibacillus hisashii TaxID=996558 RepID=UPI002E1BD1F1|nr:hypothetical protein [Caldifermentibacillus hisashii]
MNTFQILFERLSIRGDIFSVIEEKNYEAIQFGEDFKSLCDHLELDEKVVQKYILDYALYEVYKECCTFSGDDLDLLEMLGDEAVNGLTLGDILDEKYCISPDSFYENFGYLLNDKSDQITERNEAEKIIHFIQDSSQLKSKNFAYVPQEGTLFHVFKDKLKRHRQPFNKSADKLNVVKDIDKFKNNTSFFLQQLSEAKSINYTQDIDSFEKSANTLFIFELYNCIWKSQTEFDNGKEDYYFNTLSSLVIIENLELKLFILKNLIEKKTIFTYPKFEFALLLNKVYILSMVYPLLIKEFIKQKFDIATNNLTANEVNPFVDAKTKSLKKSAFIFGLLHNHKGYNLKKLIEVFEPIQVHNKGLFGNLYTRVSKLQEVKNEVMDQFKVEFYEMIEIFSYKESLSKDDIIFISEGYPMKMQKKIVSSWRNIRKK